MTFEIGDFSFIQNNMFKHVIQNAYTYVNNNNLWEFFKTYTPEHDKGYMFSKHPTLDQISTALDKDGHSAASFALTMRNMQLIANNDWNTYVNLYLNN